MTKFNRRFIAALGILLFIGASATVIKLKGLLDRINDLESSVDNQSGELSDQESKIDEIRSDVDALQSQR